MAGQTRPKQQQAAAFGSSSSVCNRHPTHRQSPGVCSVCVNERLARLSSTSATSSSHKASISSSSSLSEVSSCSSSEYSSPARIRARYVRRGSVSFVKRSEKDQNHDVVLSKSRSMAAAFVRRVRGGSSGSVPKENKMSGFWSKVLTRTRRKNRER